MAILRIGGLPVTGAVRFGGLPLAGAAHVAGLGPLPPATTPAAPGTIPAPYAYFAFDDYDPWESATGVGEITAEFAGQLWGRELGGIYQYKAVDPEGLRPHRLTGLTSGRTSLALSVWLEPGETLDLGYADGHWGMGQMSAGGTSPQHWLLLLTSSHAYRWRNGVAQTEWGTLRTETTLYLRQYETHGISELAIWESPDWTESEAAAIAAALYNDGLGTVYRDGQWWEVADV